MKKLFAMLLAMAMVLSLAACSSNNPDPSKGAEPPANSQAGSGDNNPAAPETYPNKIDDNPTSADGKYEIAMITDVGDLKDGSFNEGTWNGVKLYAAANGKDL